ncbi:hypothetical protein GCM10023116_39060 [Kistimonas scapharcae]|uniref:ParB/Sulfiredoxin domain-containing protein n=1 Tax=Kistimonas scapharcae TaxID=1036133 RepID=A0ABP8V723_9GAMM
MLTNDIKYDKTLYPRIAVIPELVQKYVQDIDHLPPIEVDQNNRIIDGVHRWMVHCKDGRTEIETIVTRVTNDDEFLELAIHRNDSHGQQLSQDDKRKMAIHLYKNKDARERKGNKEVLSRILSTTKRTLERWVSDIDSAENEKRDSEIKILWMGCYDEQTIADKVGVTRQRVNQKLENLANLRHLSQNCKLSATYQEPDFEIPLYKIWNDARLTSKVGADH